MKFDYQKLKLNYDFLTSVVTFSHEMKFDRQKLAPHEYADKCVTSIPERLELYGKARPKPPTLRRRAPKNTKTPSASFLAGIRVAQKRLNAKNVGTYAFFKKSKFVT